MRRGRAIVLVLALVLAAAALPVGDAKKEVRGRPGVLTPLLGPAPGVAAAGEGGENGTSAEGDPAQPQPPTSEAPPPAEPTPSEPAPSEPAPSEPAPSEPTPGAPAPSEPAQEAPPAEAPREQPAPEEPAQEEESQVEPVDSPPPRGPRFDDDDDRPRFGEDDEDELDSAAAGGATGAIAVGALVALLLLTLALAGIWWARRPSERAPPKRTFEAGRSRAHAKRPLTPQEAIEAFGAAHMGSVVWATPVLDGYEVTVARKRSQPCRQTAGFLAGLFESAWADAVRVEHVVCAGEGGGECRYVVRRGAAISGSGRPTEGASTPGSAGARRRSPPARPGGG